MKRCLTPTLISVIVAFSFLVSSCSTKPSPYTVMEPYLKAWEEARYGDMYDLLSSHAQAGISRERFIQRYTAISQGSTILSVKTSFSRDDELDRAESRAALPFTVAMSTARVGEIREENVLPVIFEVEHWRVDWTPSLIFKDLSGANRILFEPEDTLRGTIYDRKGRPLATKGKVVSLGVVPGQIEDEQGLLEALEQQLGIPWQEVRRASQFAQPDWFVPLRDLSLARAAQLRPKLESIPGVLFQEKPARVYPNGSLAAHVVGYLGRVTAQELEAMAPRGYGEEDMVGRSGIEAWAEEVLAGERGGSLSVVTPEGGTVKVIAQKSARDGRDIHLSLDLDLQRLAEESLGSQAGSVVILDVPNSSILALASYPRYDPNQFVTGFTDDEWRKLSEDPLRPFQNRPVASSYPTGSVFKVVTMAAALEKGGFSPDSPFDCAGRWDGLGGGVVLGDWLPQGHGHLDLFQGLVESCNIVFYEAGKKLDSTDPDLLPYFARGFGFGQPTGLVGLEEASGTVPDPAWKRANQGAAWYPGDGVNLAIGQGSFLATPLQVANGYAAIGRGGSLTTPVLVVKQGDQGFHAQPRDPLPASPATLDVIRQAMERVVSDPKGTASYAFRGFNRAVAAKTGSAEVAGGSDTHAWFAAYAPAERPEIALAVMVESKGHGGEVAAPVARMILDGYFK